MLSPLKGVCSHYRLLFFPHHPPPPTYAQPSQKPPGFGSLGTDHINDCCGFCAANQGSVEESAAAREFLLTLQIYVEYISIKLLRSRFDVRRQDTWSSGCMLLPLLGSSVSKGHKGASGRLDIPAFWVLVTQMCSIGEHSISCAHTVMHTFP